MVFPETVPLMGAEMAQAFVNASVPEKLLPDWLIDPDAVPMNPRIDVNVICQLPAMLIWLDGEFPLLQPARQKRIVDKPRSRAGGLVGIRHLAKWKRQTTPTD
jgi:hypothetical protein